MIKNPFPGPQPYRASDRQRFYGREDLSYKLECSLLSNRCVTVYGPSGAGKSSLVQASALPALIEHQDVRVVKVDGWPEGEDPTRWLASAMYSDLRLGELPADASPRETVLAAVQRAVRGSSRFMVVYLDQLEQLLYTSRTLAETEPFFACLDELVELPLRSLRVILSLREDYLGRFRDRLRERQHVLDGGFRVGPLTVAELCGAVCKTAAAGEPSQAWSPDQMRTLMLQVRVPGQAATDEAEAQSAYAQIVCRALFQQRAQGGAAEEGAIEAEPILQSYLETTLQDLGPLRDAAQRLLEDHLVTADGSRTLRTEKELLRVLPAAELLPCLRALEGAAVLHAEEHQGSRYFELGHDWLARRVHERRQQREREEEQLRRESELRRQRAEAEASLARERARRRIFMVVAASLFAAASAGVMGVWQWKQRQWAEEQRRWADEKRSEAHDASILSGYRELVAKNRLAWAIKLLPEVERATERSGWVALANEALEANALRATLFGHQNSLSAAVFSPDDARVLTASADRTARVWSADGKGQPVVLKGHEGRIVFATFIPPEGKRVLTASADGTARVWNADGTGEPIVLKGNGEPIVSAAMSPDGKRVVAVFDDGAARVYAADGSGEPTLLKGREGRLTVASFHPDSVRVLAASRDGTVQLWTSEASDKPRLLKGHTAEVTRLTVSPDGTRIVTASLDKTVRVWDVNGAAPPVTLPHDSDVWHADVSRDGKRVATACSDGTARIWRMDGKGEPVVLRGHERSVNFVAFAPDGEYVATASSDGTARLWPSDGKGAPFVLSGHEAPVRSVVWSLDGSRVLTAASDPNERSADRTAKVWSADPLKALLSVRRGGGFIHSAFLDADGEHIVAAYDNNTARLFRISSREEPVVFKGHKDWVASAVLSPNRDRVVTASFDKTARVYRVDGTGDPVVLTGHEGDLRFAAVSPDGTRIVTVSEDKTARVYRVDGAGEPVVLNRKGHEDWLTSAAWSPDSTRIVTTSQDHTARVWKADGSGEPVVLRGHGDDVLSAAVSPDGKRIITTSEDHTARIWDADSGREMAVLEGHEEAVLHAIWSPDGKRIATSSDKTVRLWSGDGSGPDVVLKTQAPVIAMAFHDLGQTLLTIASDNTTHRWRIDVAALKERLRKAHVDCLPPEMRVTYLLESEDEARARYEACECLFERIPFRTGGTCASKSPSGGVSAPVASGAPLAEHHGEQVVSQPLLKDRGPGMRRVKQRALPGDANIEVNGIPIRRRQGVLEMIVKVGESLRVRVSKGPSVVEQNVTIPDTGAPLPALSLPGEPSNAPVDESPAASATPDAGPTAPVPHTAAPKSEELPYR